MNLQALARAILAHQPTDVDVYEDEAPQRPGVELPWIVLNVLLPKAAEKSDAGNVIAQDVGLLVTLTANNDIGIRALAVKMFRAFDDALVEAPGWAPARLRRDPGITQFTDDQTEIPASNLPVHVAKFTYSLTACPRP
jgi:hypothetical protein